MIEEIFCGNLLCIVENKSKCVFHGETVCGSAIRERICFLLQRLFNFQKTLFIFFSKNFMLRILKLFFHFFRALIGSLCNAAVNICTYSLQFMNMVHYTDHWSGCIAQCAINSINTPYTNHKTRGLGRFLFWYSFVNIIINNSIRICSKQYTDGPNSEVNFGLHETVEFLMYQTFIGTFPNSI